MTKAATNAWGNAGRYYAAEQAFHAKPSPPDKVAQRLAEALEKSSPGIRQADMNHLRRLAHDLT